MSLHNHSLPFVKGELERDFGVAGGTTFGLSSECAGGGTGWEKSLRGLGFAGGNTTDGVKISNIFV
jgi:hypothetical protein